MDGRWVDVGRCVYIVIARAISPAVVTSLKVFKMTFVYFVS